MTPIRTMLLAVSLFSLSMMTLPDAALARSTATTPGEVTSPTTASAAPTSTVATTVANNDYASRDAEAKQLESWEGGGTAIYLSSGAAAVIIVILVLILVL